MNRKLFLISALMSALLLAACAAPTPTPAPPTAAPAALPTVAATRPAPTATTAPTPLTAIKIKVAYSAANPDPAVIWIAQDTGIFKKNGLDAEIIFTSGGGRTAQALLSGDVQVAVLAPASVVEAVAAGADLVMIAGLVNTINYDFVVLPAITKADDLKGKKGAVSGPTGSSATATRYALREILKLDPDKDVTLLTIGSEPDRVAALATKQIDFSVLNPDITPDAVKAGAAVLLKLWDRNIDYQHTGVATSRKLIKDNPAIAKRFIQSVVEATAYAKDPKNKAAVMKIIGAYLKTDKADFLENAYERMTKTVMQAAPYVTLKGMEIVLTESKQAQEKGLKVSDVVDNGYIKELDDSGFIKGLYSK